MTHVTFACSLLARNSHLACNAASKCRRAHRGSSGSARRTGLRLIHLLLIHLLWNVLKRIKHKCSYFCTVNSRNWCRTRREKREVEKGEQRFTLCFGFNLFGGLFEVYICISFGDRSTFERASQNSLAMSILIPIISLTNLWPRMSTFTSPILSLLINTLRMIHWVCFTEFLWSSC